MTPVRNQKQGEYLGTIAYLTPLDRTLSKDSKISNPPFILKGASPFGRMSKC